MDDTASSEVTRCLLAWQRGDEGALDELVPVVYGQLRRLARSQLRTERLDHSYDSADLVSELYLKLVDQKAANFRNRVQFFAICARLLRRILVDHARKRATAKRLGEARKVPIEEAANVATIRDRELLVIDEALAGLEAVDPRKARLIELRFFGGLRIEEAAAALGCSHATVEREWTVARAWLRRELRRPRP